MPLELRPPTSPSHSRWYPGQRGHYTENTCEPGVIRGGTIAQNRPGFGVKDCEASKRHKPGRRHFLSR